MYSRVPPCYGSTSRWRGVSFANMQSSTPQQAHPYLRWISPQGSPQKANPKAHPPSTMGPSTRWTPDLYNGVRHHPQLNWGLSSNHNLLNTSKQAINTTMVVKFFNWFKAVCVIRDLVLRLLLIHSVISQTAFNPSTKQAGLWIIYQFFWHFGRN